MWYCLYVVVVPSTPLDVFFEVRIGLSLELQRAPRRRRDGTVTEPAGGDETACPRTLSQERYRGSEPAN